MLIKKRIKEYKVKSAEGGYETEQCYVVRVKYIRIRNRSYIRFRSRPMFY